MLLLLLSLSLSLLTSSFAFSPSVRARTRGYYIIIRASPSQLTAVADRVDAANAVAIRYRAHCRRKENLPRVSLGSFFLSGARDVREARADEIVRFATTLLCRGAIFSLTINKNGVKYRPGSPCWIY